MNFKEYNLFKLIIFFVWLFWALFALAICLPLLILCFFLVWLWIPSRRTELYASWFAWHPILFCDVKTNKTHIRWLTPISRYPYDNRWRVKDYANFGFRYHLINKKK